MLGKKQDDLGENGPLLTVMGQSARLEGKFNITDSIQIECELAGEIHVEGKLVIGKKGVVRADAHTKEAIIMGKYEGNMVAGNVEITSTGQVTGNIETDSLVISTGGFFNGNVTRMREDGQIALDRRASGPTLVEKKQEVNKPV